MTVRQSVLPHDRATNVKGHTFYLVWEPVTWYCTSILWSIVSSQNRVPTDQYDLTVSRAHVWSIGVVCFLCVLGWQVTSFQLIEGSIPSGFRCYSCTFIVWSKLWIYERELSLSALAKSVLPLEDWQGHFHPRIYCGKYLGKVSYFMQ